MRIVHREPTRLGITALASLLSTLQPLGTGAETLMGILDENVFTENNPSVVAESRFDRVKQLLDSIVAPGINALEIVAENASTPKTSVNLTRDGVVSSTDDYVGRLLSDIAGVPAKHDMDAINVQVGKTQHRVEVSSPNYQITVAKDIQKNRTTYDYRSGILRLVLTLGKKRSLKVYRRGVESEMIEIVNHKVKHTTVNQGYKLSSNLSRSSITLNQSDSDTLFRRQERKQGETTNTESFRVAPEFMTYLGTVSGPVVMRRRIRSNPAAQDKATITEDFKFPLMTRHIRYSIAHTSTGFECVIDLDSRATLRFMMSADQRQLWTRTVQGSRRVGSVSQPIPLVYDLLRWPKPRSVAVVPRVSMGVRVMGLIQFVEPEPLQIKETIDLSSGSRVELTVIDHGKTVEIVRNGQNLGWVELSPRERALLSQLQQLGEYAGPKELRESVLHILGRFFNPERGLVYHASISSDDRVYVREVQNTKVTWYLKEVERRSGHLVRTAIYRIKGDFVKITDNGKVLAEAEDPTLANDIRRMIRRLDPMTTIAATEADTQAPEILMGTPFRGQLTI
ncbi:MAG: hypothetical protein KVP17_002711 [Porospora cf. gigantea B]|uniref:uncharacterized protein n=1 Tax=Porospora cf. gigantea B TaxID=2853592 RepID=UPI003571892E|nr:MAG: hypothetical protein KVP17_002711 [Porospora cf. gigantea B]